MEGTVEEKQELMRDLEDLTDPRGDRNRKHKFTDIMIIAICAMICGADDMVKVAVFGKCKEDWFRKFLELPTQHLDQRPSHAAK